MRACVALIPLVLVLLSTGVDAEVQRGRRAPSVMRMTVTAYCVDGETAAGTNARRGIVAADPRVLPLGSRIRVEGLKGRRHNRAYTVEDTGRAVKGRIIDIFIDDCRAAKRFGRQKARVRVLERAPR